MNKFHFEELRKTKKLVDRIEIKTEFKQLMESDENLTIGNLIDAMEKYDVIKIKVFVSDNFEIEFYINRERKNRGLTLRVDMANKRRIIKLNEEQPVNDSSLLIAIDTILEGEQFELINQDPNRLKYALERCFIEEDIIAASVLISTMYEYCIDTIDAKLKDRHIIISLLEDDKTNALILDFFAKIKDVEFHHSYRSEDIIEEKDFIEAIKMAIDYGNVERDFNSKGYILEYKENFYEVEELRNSLEVSLVDERRIDISKLLKVMLKKRIGIISTEVEKGLTVILKLVKIKGKIQLKYIVREAGKPDQEVVLSNAVIEDPLLVNALLLAINLGMATLNPKTNGYIIDFRFRVARERVLKEENDDPDYEKEHENEFEKPDDIDDYYEDEDENDILIELVAAEELEREEELEEIEEEFEREIEEEEKDIEEIEEEIEENKFEDEDEEEYEREEQEDEVLEDPIGEEVEHEFEFEEQVDMLEDDVEFDDNSFDEVEETVEIDEPETADVEEHEIEEVDFEEVLEVDLDDVDAEFEVREDGPDGDDFEDDNDGGIENDFDSDFEEISNNEFEDDDDDYDYDYDSFE